MTLLEDMQSGKYNLVLFGIILVLFYQCYLMTNNKTPEYFGSVTTGSQLQGTVTSPSTDTSITTPSTLQVTGVPSFNDTIYYANLDNVQKVAGVIRKIESDGLIFNGKIKEAGNVLIPRGSIIMWSGSSTAIPTGWALCDGQNGTPNLRGRFVLGAGKGQNLTDRVVGQMGGLETVTLSLNQIPSHTHNVSYRTDNDATAPSYGESGQAQGTDLRKESTTKTATTTPTPPQSDGGKSHENMPPFYVLAYIMKL